VACSCCCCCCPASTGPVEVTATQTQQIDQRSVTSCDKQQQLQPQLHMHAQLVGPCCTG
jgi:hypothetical protein